MRTVGAVREHDEKLVLEDEATREHSARTSFLLRRRSRERNEPLHLFDGLAVAHFRHPGWMTRLPCSHASSERPTFLPHMSHNASHMTMIRSGEAGLCGRDGGRGGAGLRGGTQSHPGPHPAVGLGEGGS